MFQSYLRNVQPGHAQMWFGMKMAPFIASSIPYYSTVARGIPMHPVLFGQPHMFKSDSSDEFWSEN